MLNNFLNFTGSPRVEGDEDEDDVDDIENEFNYAQGANKARHQRHGEEFSSSSRHESQPIPLLTHGHTVETYIFSLDSRVICMSQKIPRLDIFYLLF